MGIPATRKTLKRTTRSRPVSRYRRVAGRDGNYPLPATHFATPTYNHHIYLFSMKNHFLTGEIFEKELYLFPTVPLRQWKGKSYKYHVCFLFMKNHYSK